MFQQAASVLLGVVAGKAGKEALKDLVGKYGAEFTYKAKHYAANIPREVPSSIRVKIEWVVTSFTGLMGFDYSAATGSYDDPFN